MFEPEQKENFCSPCVVAPLALASAGGMSLSKNQKMIWFYALLTIILICVFIYFKTRCKTCNKR